jgi:hypothetical protein
MDGLSDCYMAFPYGVLCLMYIILGSCIVNNCLSNLFDWTARNYRYYDRFSKDC